MFKENFIKICNKHGEAPSAVCQKVGLSNAAFSNWKDDSVPRRATLQKFADYFGITVDELLSEEDTKKESPPVGEPSKLEKEFSNLIRDIPEEQGQALLQFLKSWKKEQ